LTYVYYFDGEAWSQVRTPASGRVAVVDGLSGQAVYFADLVNDQLTELLYPHPISAFLTSP
jgi:hypothetical protein